MKKLKLASRAAQKSVIAARRNISKDPTPMGAIDGIDDEIAEEEVEEETRDVGPPEDDLDLSPPKSHVTEWEGRDVFIAFPSYKHTNPATAWCLLATALDLGKEKVRFDMELGDAMIYHARNNLVRKFLETPAQWLVFVDDDMLYPIGRPGFLRQMARLPQTYPDAPLSLNAITRLVGHGQPIVGATYFTRHPQSLPVNSLRGNQQYMDAVHGFTNKIMPCSWVGTGLMAIHRSVFETMMEKLPQLAPANDQMPWNFFQPGANGSGEDVAFCERAVSLGYQPQVDTMLQAFHIGSGVYGSHTAAI